MLNTIYIHQIFVDKKLYNQLDIKIMGNFF